MIPKTIYYCWFGGSKLPLEIIENIESWKKFNRDYNIVQIDETRTDLFNYTDYSFAKEAYKSKKWAFVSDIARLHVIYENGGIYLDTDVELLKPLDEILNYDEVWAKENRHTIATGLILAAERKTENIKNILKIYKGKQFDRKKLNSISTVNVISKYFWGKGLKIKNNQVALIGGTAIYPTNAFAPIHYWGGGKITGRSYAVHKYKASWVTEDKRLLNYVRKYLRWGFNTLILKCYIVAYIVAKIKYR